MQRACYWYYYYYYLILTESEICRQFFCKIPYCQLYKKKYAKLLSSSLHAEKQRDRHGKANKNKFVIFFEDDNICGFRLMNYYSENQIRNVTKFVVKNSEYDTMRSVLVWSKLQYVAIGGSHLQKISIKSFHKLK
jgi:predicted oxidoreductase (fatty acid repression mutant protein)